MTQRLPAPHEAQQLSRLRALRVQRARSRCAEVQAELAQAAQAVRERQRQVQQHRRTLGQLAHDTVHGLAPHLPRWQAMVAAQRARLDDLLERAEYALAGERQALEETEERLQQARAELTRALAREDAVRGLAQEVHRSHAAANERLLEREQDDQGCAIASVPARSRS